MIWLYALGVLAAYLLLNLEFITSQEKIRYNTTDVFLTISYSIVLSFFSWFYVITYAVTRQKSIRTIYKVITHKELMGHFG